MILAINSPGGTTAGGEELYEALGGAARQEAGGRGDQGTRRLGRLHDGDRAPTASSRGGCRSSARSACCSRPVNAGKLLDTIGVDLDKVASGPLKAEPDFDEPMTPEVRASLQSLVNDSFDWFVDIVAERRGMTAPEVLALADGRIVTGRQGSTPS